MIYKDSHAERALEIVKRILPEISHRDEYDELVDVLSEKSRWHEAHGLFTRIRTNITLPFENSCASRIERCFAYVAENAAKTAFNCSGSLAPFDDDSFDWLLHCEKDWQEAKDSH